MAKFVPGVDTSIVSNEPILEILASSTQPLQAGRHVFQLIVADNHGNASQMDSISIVVRDPTRPTAQIDFLHDDDSRKYDATISIAFGKPFRLTGARSSDGNGVIRTWRWTHLAP
jgi:hypothetical protein